MNPQQKPRPIKVLIMFCLFAYGAWWSLPTKGTNEVIIHYFFLFMTGIFGLQVFFLILMLFPRYILYKIAMRKTSRSGSAGWASGWDLWKAKLYRSKGFLLGLYKNKFPVRADIATCGLVLSPAGGGKTNGIVIPALCQCADSMFVPDLKCVLAPMTAPMRKKKFKHQIACLNPIGLHQSILGPSASYNPLIILIDDWKNTAMHGFLFNDATAVAHQLCQDPPNQGEHQYFRNGSRKFLVFVFLHLVVSGGKATLTDALNLLCDMSAFTSALYSAKASTVLSGDMARLAKDLISKIEEGDKKQIESFREGAVQSLEIFSPSSSLAACTSSCSFRFSELKTKKMTIYLMADPTRQAVFAPWLGLLSWCALTELIRSPSNKKVVFMLDEICNFKIYGLPSLMTIAREFKIVLWMIVQELEQWGMVYGRETIETLLSQTEVKVFMGVRSLRTCQLISDMLGEETVKSKNYSLGVNVYDDIQRSVNEGPRKLLTADEVRRTNDTLIFIKDKRPIRLQPIGYHEVSPWKHQVGINPLYGKKFKGRTRLRV